MKTERERKLEAAMQFYARHKTWNAEPYEVAPAIIDAGRNAREALADEDAGGGEPSCNHCLDSGVNDDGENCTACRYESPPQQRDALEAVRRLPERMRESAGSHGGTDEHAADRWERFWADELDRALAQSGA